MHLRLWTRLSLPLLHLLNVVAAQDPLEDDAGLSSFVTVCLFTFADGQVSRLVVCTNKLM